MHPAGSVIIFTVASGIGFGLLAFLGLGLPAVQGWAAFWYFAVGFALAVGGLVSSTFHLGNPQRALKAFTQWRTSWLSREGWFSVTALICLGIYALFAVFFGRNLVVFGVLGAVFSLLTVFATSMLYTQLKTVPRWNTWTTPVMFILLSIAGGALLAGHVWFALILMIAAGVMQVITWVLGDKRFSQAGSNIGSATGLGERGDVRAFEPPHTGNNYLLKEMVHEVGRKHAMKLRVIALVLMAVVPVLILLVSQSVFAIAAAAILHLIGVLAQRWLFFAEAEHVVGLYYGKR